MFIKRYTASTMTEATDQIRREMGLDAVIVSSRTDRAPGIRGWLGQKVFEVVAALDESENRDRPIEHRSKDMNYRSGDQLADIESQLSQIQDLLSKTMSFGQFTRSHTNQRLQKLADRWLETAISSTLFERFMREYVANIDSFSNHSIVSAAREFTHSVLTKAGPGRPILSTDRVVALIGPTGVGKTTTIAKLAAHALIHDERRVGLLTLDTYRVGAVAQLKTYADILNIPFAVAGTPLEARSAFHSLEACDLILVDTTGRSFFDRSQVSELKEILGTIPVNLTYLVLSLTLRRVEASSISHLLNEIGYDALLFTKNDEAIMPTLALSMLDELRKPLSYIGTGQEVPGHLRPADPDWLCDLMAGGELLA